MVQTCDSLGKESQSVVCFCQKHGVQEGGGGWTPHLLLPLSSSGVLGRRGEGGAGWGTPGGPWRPVPGANAFFCLLSLQYFSTLENSIVSLFVLLTTAK